MAKNDYKRKIEETVQIVETVKEITVEEAKALRASKHAALPKKLSDLEKREEFRLFWAEAKSKYGRPKEMESVLWVHLKAINMDNKKDFEAGLENFGLKEISK
jgi:hypothetical protein